MRREKDKPDANMRTRAEKLVGSTPAVRADLSPKKMRALIHELQVHQIELGMQNEELLRAREELESARDRYFELYDLAPVGYLTLHRDGTILQANLRAAELMGRPRSHLLKRKFEDLVAASHVAAFVGHLQRFGEEGGRRSCEVALRRRDGTALPVHLETVRVDKGENDETFELRTTLTDITERLAQQAALRRARDELEVRVQERTEDLAWLNQALEAEIVEHKQTERRLLQKNELLEGMFGSIHFLVAYMDKTFTFIRVNEAYARAGGRAPEFFIGKRHFDLYPSDDHEVIFEKVVATGEPYFAYEAPFVHAPNQNPGRGVAFWDWSLLPIKEAEGSVSGVVLTLVDVTERRRAQEQLLSYQEQLRSLASELMLTEERERRRLATDLHDSVCQLLALSKLKLDMARSTVSPGGLSASLEAVQSLIGQAINESRLLMFELSPQVLYLSGVETALKALFRKLREAHGLVVTFGGDGQPDRLSEDLRVFIYGAVRELLTNIVKHARTEAATVSFRQEDAHMYICVEDGGVGFDVSQLDSMRAEEGGGRFGLFSLRERSRHLGGRLEILSKPSQGTRVTVIVPVSGTSHA
jgi:PAS domain S-box-containing protein